LIWQNEAKAKKYIPPINVDPAKWPIVVDAVEN
jgi:hypothetical protein